MLDAPRRAYRFMKLYSQHLPYVYDALFALPCAVTRLHGKLKGSDEWATILYVGRRVNYEYLLRTIFDEHSVVDSQVTNLLAYRKHMDRMSNDSDVVVMDLGWPYSSMRGRKGGYLAVPDWMNMAIEFPEHWEDVVHNFRRTARKHDLRLIRRNGYRCEPGRSRAAAETFYDEMYLPFVNQRHAAESVIAPKSHVIKQALKGQLLHVMRGDEIVAAGVIYPEGEVMFSLWMGIPARHLEQQPEAAISALYYFGIQYAFDNGYKVFDFTGTRAFLTDGAYQFKRRWGPVIEDNFSPGSILLKPAPSNRQAALFCQQVPALRRTGTGLEAVFVRVDEPADDNTFTRLEKDFGCAGLERMTLIEISGGNETKVMPMSDAGCQYRLVRCSLESFAECYVNI